MFPSELTFYSALCLFKEGQGAKLSKLVRDVIKRDSNAVMATTTGTITVRGIGDVIERIKKRINDFPMLKECLTKDCCLIPMPRSTPLVDKSALWPSLRICEELKQRELAGSILPIVERVKAIPKAAFAEPGKRPNPSTHFESTTVQNCLERPSKIALVGDFITRGSTFVGVYHHVRKQFPNAQIVCFGLMRTAYGEGHQVMEPVKGTITLSHYRSGEPCLVRKP